MLKKSHNKLCYNYNKMLQNITDLVEHLVAFIGESGGISSDVMSFKAFGFRTTGLSTLDLFPLKADAECTTLSVFIFLLFLPSILDADSSYLLKILVLGR